MRLRRVHQAGRAVAESWPWTSTRTLREFLDRDVRLLLQDCSRRGRCRTRRWTWSSRATSSNICRTKPRSAARSMRFIAACVPEAGWWRWDRTSSTCRAILGFLGPPRPADRDVAQGGAGRPGVCASTCASGGSCPTPWRRDRDTRSTFLSVYSGCGAVWPALRAAVPRRRRSTARRGTAVVECMLPGRRVRRSLDRGVLPRHRGRPGVRIDVIALVVLVTGSSGLIGSEVCSYFAGPGMPCTASTTISAPCSSARRATRAGTSSGSNASFASLPPPRARHPRPAGRARSASRACARRRSSTPRRSPRTTAPRPFRSTTSTPTPSAR